MQFNSETNSQDIVSMADDLAKSNSVSFPIAKKVLYANQAVRIIKSWIGEAYGGWIYDDSNKTDLPEATATLVSGQTNYTLPIDASAVQGISCKDQGGEWYKLQPITLEQIQDRGIAESQFESTNSQPIYYRLLGNSFKTYPASNYTQASSIKLHETRDISQFTVTDTTNTPGFDYRYHEAVPTFMALQFKKINGEDSRSLMDDWLRYEVMIKKDFSKRLAELFPARIKVADALLDYQ
jgi:hypothetical protein